MLSVIVLSTTGYAWATLHMLNSGMATSDVIGPPSPPDGATDILLVGNDSRTDANGNPLPANVLKELRTGDEEGGDLTDSMILVRVPNGGGRATAVSFPRDTMVDLGDGFGEAKLNSAMGRAKAREKERLQSEGVTDPKQLEKQSRQAGQKFLIQTINKLAGVNIDHYAEVNLLGFYQITQAVGGVDVCLKNPVNDPWSGAKFPAGRQTVEGGDALAFVRQRHGLLRGDLDRVVRQQVFMSGLANKMLSSGTLANPSKMSGLIQAVQQSVVLDTGWDPISFAEQMHGITGGNIEFHTIPVRLEGPSGEEQVVANPQEVQQFVADLLLPPAEREKKQQEREATQRARKSINVSVYNSSGISGLAARVLSSLGSAGFAKGGGSNAQTRASSVVYYAPGDQAAGQQVAQALGGLPTEPSSNLSKGSVEVYLGKDYKGPGVQQFAGTPAVQLDGLQHQAQPALAAPQPAQPPATDQTITADGIPCVN